MFVVTLPVYSLLVMEIVQTVTTSHQTYWYMVLNWNNPGALVLFPWSAMTVPTIDGLSERKFAACPSVRLTDYHRVAFFVQAFYSWYVAA